MKVLMISLDASLASEQPVGDVLERMREYAKQVEQLDVLVLSSQATEKKEDRLNIVSAGGRSKLARFFRAWRQARVLSKGKNVVTAQDPFFAGLIGWLSARRENIPLVLDVHGDFFGEFWRRQHWLTGFFLLKLAKFLLKRAKTVRVVNPKIQEDIIHIGIDFRKIHCLPVPVDLSKFEQYNPEHVERIQKEINGDHILLFVGRLSMEKGVQYLIEALGILKKTVPRARLVIVGEGPYRESLENRVKREGLEGSVWFTGKVSANEIADYYHACDVFVLPSSHESFGRVILEAAMAKKPVVATNTIGARYQIKSKSYFPNDQNEVTGYIVSTHSSYKLAKELEYVWSNYEEAKSVGERLYEKKKQKYDYHKGITGIINLWKLAAGS